MLKLSSFIYCKITFQDNLLGLFLGLPVDLGLGVPGNLAGSHVGVHAELFANDAIELVNGVSNPGVLSRKLGKAIIILDVHAAITKLHHSDPNWIQVLWINRGVLVLLHINGGVPWAHMMSNETPGSDLPKVSHLVSEAQTAIRVHVPARR